MIYINICLRHFKFFLLLFILSSFIVIRHDRDDSEYIKYGREGGFESLVSFKHGNGTLIHPFWVLTAEHVTIGVYEGSIASVNGKEYEVDKVYTYPQEENNVFKKKDIALVKLKKEVTNVKPAKYATKSPKRNSLIHLAGTGRTGNGKSQSLKADKIIRGATNIIDNVTELFISFDFDRPDSKDVTILEGVSGLGDSGGPAFIKNNNELLLVGVCSFSHHEGIPEGNYGTVDYYVNVASFSNWIETILGGTEYFEIKYKEKTLIASILNNNILSLSIDGKVASIEEQNELRKIVLEKHNAYLEKLGKTEQKLVKFLRFINQIAKKENIIEVSEGLTFMLSGNQLLINNKKVSSIIHKETLVLYEELFKEKLVGDNNIFYDSNK